MSRRWNLTFGQNPISGKPTRVVATRLSAWEEVRMRQSTCSRKMNTVSAMHLMFKYSNSNEKLVYKLAACLMIL